MLPQLCNHLVTNCEWTGWRWIEVEVLAVIVCPVLLNVRPLMEKGMEGTEMGEGMEGEGLRGGGGSTAAVVTGTMRAVQ